MIFENDKNETEKSYKCHANTQIKYAALTAVGKYFRAVVFVFLNLLFIGTLVVLLLLLIQYLPLSRLGYTPTDHRRGIHTQGRGNLINISTPLVLMRAILPYTLNRIDGATIEAR